MTAIKRILFAAAICFAIVFLCAPASADGPGERILSFDSEITVHEDASMSVCETITVRSLGQQIQHGIYRDFPTRYKDSWGNSYVVGFDVTGVSRDGQPEPYKVENYANGKRVRIGSADTIIPQGEHTYVISYQTNRQLGFFADHDELYWNVTGNGWAFPIDEATARVTVAGASGSDILSHEAYTGPQGSKEGNYISYVSPDGTVNFSTTSPLGTNEGLTIVVTWPKGLIEAPSGLTLLGYLLHDNAGLIIALVGLICLLIYYFSVWRRVGRDPAKGTIIPRFAPPEGFSPASVRYVIRMGYDHKALTAAVVNMAVKRYIFIRQDGKKFSIEKDQADKFADLSPAEQAAATALFGEGDSYTFSQANYRQCAAAVAALQKYLQSKFKGKLFKTNAGLAALGWLFSVIVIGTGFVVSPSAIILAAGAVLAIVINIIFTRLLKAPTAQGRRVMDEIEGFRMYLDVAEKERLDLLNPPEETPELFEKYLPYAIALGVEGRWAERFAGVLARAASGGEAYHPAWYYGTSWSAMQVGHFTNTLSSSFNGAIAASSSPPGSSSGSGGGGSSGGGGGGGGGGGW